MADKITIENAKVGKDGVQMKTSKAGKEYAAFTVMWSSSRKSMSGQGRDYGPTKFVNVKVFGFAAADVVASVQAGDRVNVSGNVEHFVWESNNGPKDDWSMFAESVTLPMPRAQQGGFQQQRGPASPQQNQQAAQGYTGDNDPWSSQPQGGFGGSDQDEPPF